MGVLIMRGLYSSKTKIRQQIFTEVARFAYEGGDYSKFESLPYKIILARFPLTEKAFSLSVPL